MKRTYNRTCIRSNGKDEPENAKNQAAGEAQATPAQSDNRPTADEAKRSSTQLPEAETQPTQPIETQQPTQSTQPSEAAQPAETAQSEEADPSEDPKMTQDPLIDEANEDVFSLKSFLKAVHSKEQAPENFWEELQFHFINAINALQALDKAIVVPAQKNAWELPQGSLSPDICVYLPEARHICPYSGEIDSIRLTIDLINQDVHLRDTNLYAWTAALVRDLSGWSPEMISGVISELWIDPDRPVEITPSGIIRVRFLTAGRLFSQEEQVAKLTQREQETEFLMDSIDEGLSGDAILEIIESRQKEIRQQQLKTPSRDNTKQQERTHTDHDHESEGETT